MADTGTEQEQVKSAANDETMWAVFCHLGGLFGVLFPPANVIIPLVIWLIHREKYPLVDANGREAVNFQISVSIYAIASAILVLIAIGVLLLVLLGIFVLVVTVVAAIKAGNRETYSYPLTIRLIR